MKQPPGDVKKGTLEEEEIMQGARQLPTGNRDKKKTGPPVAQSTQSHTSIRLAEHIIKRARLPPRNSSGCLWLCTASSSMSVVMSTVGSGGVPVRPE